MQTERRKSARWAGALAAWAALICAVGLGHPVGGSSANGRVFHAATGGAPVGLCAGGQVKPGRPGSPILRTLPIPSADVGVVDERTGRVFVASGFGAGGICTLDARSGVVLNTTPIGGATALAVDPLTNRVFVANQGARSVSVLDARTGRLLRTVPLRGDPHAVTVDAATGRVFLADGNDPLISVLDARTGALLHTIPVGSGPHSQPQAIAVDSATAHAFVANSDATLSMLDLRTNRAVGTIHLAGLAAQLAVDARTRHVFVGVLLSSGAAINMYDARNGRLMHTAALGRAPVSTPAVDARTGQVVALVASPLDREGQTATGPGAVVSLDGVTGAVRRGVDVGTVYSRDTDGLLAVAARARRAIALTTDAVWVLDLTRL